jgi:hypothetical protein
MVLLLTAPLAPPLPPARFYEIRPIDVKGTDGAGLDHALSDEIYAVLGVKKR